MRLDPLDAALVRLLQEDARLSYRALAARLGSTTPTISARVRNLERLGVIRGYRADVDPAVVPGTLHVLTARGADGAAGRIAEKARALPGVEEVLVFADGRVQARVRGDDEATAALASLRRLNEVADVDDGPVAAVPLASPPKLVGDEVAVACHQCGGPIAADPVRATVGERAHVFCCRHCLTTFRERYAKAAARSHR